MFKKNGPKDIHTNLQLVLSFFQNIKGVFPVKTILQARM